MPCSETAAAHVAMHLQCVQIKLHPERQIIHTVHSDHAVTHGPRCQCCVFGAYIAKHTHWTLNLLQTKPL